MRISPPGNRGQAGFSMLELLVVLILMGAVAAVIVPSFMRGISGIELETAGRDLITHMKQARTRAIAQQKTFRVILWETPGDAFYYSLTNDFEEEIRREELSPEISLLPGDGEFPLRISFYANGRSSGARFALKNVQGRQMAVEVDAITGFARVLPRDER